MVELVLRRVPAWLSKLSYTIHAEVADTPQKRRQGLSGRPGLEPGYGMLYVYDEPTRPEFSEAETPFPLSVAFIAADGSITEIQRTDANDPRIIKPAEPVKYALEVRSGWFEDRGVRPGEAFRIPPIVPPPARETPAPTAPDADDRPAGPVPTGQPPQAGE